MNISLYNIRRLGYIKIIQNYDLKEIQDLITEYNNKYSDIKVSSFSVPKKWKDIQHKPEGITKFMLSCEPMIDNIDADEYVQRRFRNRYHRLWSEFGTMLDLSVTQSYVLEELSLKFLYVDEVPLILIELLNLIIQWYLITQTDVSCREYGFTDLDLISVLVCKTPKEFIRCLMEV
jgi:hypothetical protein